MSNKVIASNIANRLTVLAKKITGWQQEGVDNRELNQVLYQAITDHIWGTSAQVTAGEADFYTDGSGNPLNASAAAVTINEDDKILINHDVTQTANLLLDAGGVKITLEMYGGVTLDMDTYDLTLGGSGDSIGGDIRITQTGNLIINGNRGTAINNSVAGVFEDFKTKNLIVNFQSTTTVDLDADSIIFIDENGNGVRINDIDTTFNITTDLMSGTSEKSSTWYQNWLDSYGNRVMAPDIVSVADGDTANKLVDSVADFVTDKVHVGDIVYNLTDLTSGVVTAVDDLNTLSFATDLFPDGNEDYKIRMLSPDGLGQFKARTSAVYNNASGNIDDSTYTQIQEEKLYTQAAGQFTATVTNWSTASAKMLVKQANDWTGMGIWEIDLKLTGSFSAGSNNNFSIVISGIITESGIDQAVTMHDGNILFRAADQYGYARFPGNSSSITVELASAAITYDNQWTFHAPIIVYKKPTFAK